MATSSPKNDVFIRKVRVLLEQWFEGRFQSLYLAKPNQLNQHQVQYNDLVYPKMRGSVYPKTARRQVFEEKYVFKHKIYANIQVA